MKWKIAQGAIIGLFIWAAFDGASERPMLLVATGILLAEGVTMLVCEIGDEIRSFRSRRRDIRAQRKSRGQAASRGIEL